MASLLPPPHYPPLLLSPLLVIPCLFYSRGNSVVFSMQLPSPSTAGHAPCRLLHVAAPPTRTRTLVCLVIPPAWLMARTVALTLALAVAARTR